MSSDPAAGQIRIGDLSPDFELPDINMKMQKLSEYSGNIVLAFFPVGRIASLYKGNVHFSRFVTRP